MGTNDEYQKKSKDQKNTFLNAEEEQEKKKSDEVGTADRNPDVEDPRLFSPLQEPDRPDPSERTAADKQDSEESQD